jgi:hypothetical protein
MWVLVYCGSYICNNISCLVGFLFRTFHILAIFLCFDSLEVLPKGSQMQMQDEEKKTSLYLPSHLVFAFVPPSSFWWRLQQSSKKTIEGFTPINIRGWPPTYFDHNVLVYLPPPCFFLSSNLGTRFRLRGVDLSHPEISNFRMWIVKTIKQWFSHNFKTFPTFIFFTGI